MLIYSVTPYEEHLGTSTRQRLGEGSGAKVKSPTAARSVLGITGRSRAAQDHGHRGFFRRRDPPASHPSLRLPHEPGAFQIPLAGRAVLGGIPLVYELLRKLLKREFGSDLLAGISIVTSVLLGEYLAGSIVVLMLSGGEALESYALRSASSVLAALAKRMPSVAHRKRGSEIVDVALEEIAVGDTLVVYPHEICPVDGVVIEGHGVMDESYLTGEPFQITKTSGSAVISGAINGESALTIQATKRAGDSRYAKIMEVMRESEAKRPQLAASRRSIGRDLHAGGSGGRHPRVGHQRRSRSLPRGAGDRHALPFADRDPRRDHRLDFALRAPGDHRQEPGRAGTDRRDAGPRSSTRPER